MGIWHWQNWVTAEDLLDEWAWIPGELVQEVKAGRLVPVDKITLEPITFRDSEKAEDVASAVLAACFSAEAVQEYQRANNIHTKSGAKLVASLIRQARESARRNFDLLETAAQPSAMLPREEPETPVAFAARMREQAETPSGIIGALRNKWPLLRNYELGAYAKGLDPKDPNTRKAAEWHYQRHKPQDETE